VLTRLLPFELVWLLLLAPAILLPGRLLPLGLHWAAVLALFLFWPLRLVVTRRLSVVSPVNWCVAALLLWMPVAIWAAPSPTRAWEVAGYILYGVALAAALVNAPTVRRRPQVIAWALLAAGAGLAALGPLVMTTVTPADRWLWAAQSAARPLVGALGETINPNILAGGLLVAFPFAAALALEGGWLPAHARREGWARAGLALLAIALVGVVWLAGSRGTLLALAAIVLLLPVLRRPRLAWALIALAAGIAVLLAARWEVIAPALGAGGADSAIDFDERLEIWARAVRLIYDFPLTGAGLGAFAQVIPLLYPYFLIPATVDVPDAHQLLLQVGVDLGLPGLVAYVALLLCLFAMLAGVLRRQAGLSHALAAACVGVFAGTLVAGLFGAVNWGVKLSVLPWMAVALAVLLDCDVERDSSRSSPGAR
jgi:putative inorganic carbon (HCO3(-)) transporter